METSELALAFYRKLLDPPVAPAPATRPIPAAHESHGSSFARMLAEPQPIRLTLPDGRTALVERVGGRTARWRLRIAAAQGEPEEVDTRSIEDHFDAGWSWLRAWQAQALGFQILEHTLERLAAAVVLIDAGGNVLLQNGAARQLLQSGGALRVELGRLCVTALRRPLDAQFLDAQADKNGCSRTALSLTLHIPDNSSTVAMYAEAQRLVVRTPDARLRSDRLWLVTLFAAPTARRLSTAALQQVLRLTPGETRIVQALFAGQRLSEVAASLSISRETAKKHLSSIFRKCNVTSQAQLVRTIALGPFFAAGSD